MHKIGIFMTIETSFADNYALTIPLPNFDYLEKGWRDWKVWAIDHHLENDVVRLNVFAEPAGGDLPKLEQSFHFTIDLGGTKVSERFVSFAVACGITSEITNTREFLGRFFSMRRDGKYAIDFARYVPKKIA